MSVRERYTRAAVTYYRFGPFLELVGSSAAQAAAEIGLDRSRLARLAREEGTPNLRSAAIIREWSKWKAWQLGLSAEIRYQDLLPPGFDARKELREVREIRRR